MDLTNTDGSSLSKQDQNNPTRLDNTTLPHRIYNQQTNIQRIQTLLPQAKFEEIFPIKNALYTYDGFLKAAAKYEKFCDEVPTQTSSTPIADIKDQICKKEIATLFALLLHFSVKKIPTAQIDNTRDLWDHGLLFVKQDGCPAATATCQLHDTASSFFPPVTGKQYYARGPAALEGNHKYGRFSSIFLGDKSTLLDDPDILETSTLTAFGTAFYLYMTAQFNTPATHDIATGFWSPNNADIGNQLAAGFGLVLFVIEEELCHSEPTKLDETIKAYVQFRTVLGLDYDYNETMHCTDMVMIPADGANIINIFWNRDYTSTTAKCRVTSKESEFTVYEPNGHANCLTQVQTEIDNETSNPTPDNTIDLAKQDELYSVDSSHNVTFILPRLTDIVEVSTPQLALAASPSDPANLTLFKLILPETKFNTLTTGRNNVFKYSELEKAVKIYPFFCGEHPSIQVSDTQSVKDDLLKQACTQDIATLLAHIAYRTRPKTITNEGWKHALSHSADTVCSNSTTAPTATCQYINWNSQFFKPDTASNQSFYPRGALMLTGNDQYGLFSRNILGSKHYLLTHADRVENESWEAIVSAMWLYMIPVSPKPSMHQIAIGSWTPNLKDKINNIESGFGASILVSKPELCAATMIEEMELLGHYYTETLTFLEGTRLATDFIRCDGMNLFNQDSDTYLPFFWNTTPSTISPASCVLGFQQTAFSVFRPESYAECLQWINDEDYDPGIYNLSICVKIKLYNDTISYREIFILVFAIFRLIFNLLILNHHKKTKFI